MTRLDIPLRKISQVFKFCWLYLDFYLFLRLWLWHVRAALIVVRRLHRKLYFTPRRKIWRTYLWWLPNFVGHYPARGEFPRVQDTGRMQNTLVEVGLDKVFVIHNKSFDNKFLSLPTELIWFLYNHIVGISIFLVPP